MISRRMRQPIPSVVAYGQGGATKPVNRSRPTWRWRKRHPSRWQPQFPPRSRL